MLNRRRCLQDVPFLLESKLKDEGAQYNKGPDWSSHAVFDDNLVTGAVLKSARGVDSPAFCLPPMAGTH